MNEMLDRALPHMRRHYRSNTHWYIPHSAGRLKITLRTISPEARSFIPGITSYFHGKTTKTYVTVSDETQFAAAQAAAANKMLFYDPGELTVKWILPNGTVVEGMSVDIDVEAGTTLCICDSFWACALDVDCDITQIEFRDLPPFQGYVRIRGNKLQSLADRPVRYPHWDQVRRFEPGGVNIRGSAANPSATIATTKDISDCMNRIYVGRLFIEYAPYVTGDLADIDTKWARDRRWNVWGASATRTYESSYKRGEDGSLVLSRDFSPETVRVSFHHCGVHGVPRLSDGNEYIDWTYYACPNASPEDFDGLIDALMTKWFHTVYGSTVDGVGFTWWNVNSGASPLAEQLTPSDSLPVSGYSYEAGKPLIPAYGTLVISNRTADPVKRAEKLALLRAAGWQVTEMDDSFEEGIYATRDV